MKRSIYASKILAVFLSLVLIASCNVPLAWGEAIGGDSDFVAGANQETTSNEEIPSGTDESDSNIEITGTDPSSEEGTIDNESEDTPTVETTNETVASLLSSARSLASEPKATTPVAEIVDTDGTVVQQYTSLSNALRDGAGKTVRLLQDVSSNSTQYDINESMTLDLNNHSIFSKKDYTVKANAASNKEIEVIIKNGTIRNAFTGTDRASAVFARQGGNITLEDVTLEANSSYGYGIQIGKNGDKQQPTVTVQGFSTSIYGTIAGAAIMGNSETGDKPTLVLKEGTIQGEWYGIAGNGSIDNTSITINGGVVKALESTDAKGIYHPQDGDLTINGGKVQGPGGVQYCGAGTLKIAGGELRATEALVDPAIQKGDGSVEDGAALSLVSRGGGYGAAGSANVSITGGSLISDHNVALLEYGVEGIESLVGTLVIGGGGQTFS